MISAAVRRMLSAGVPVEELLSAIDEMEAELSLPIVDEVAEKRRAWDRERKRRARDKQKVALQ